MDPLLCFAISVVFGFVSWGLVTARYFWPALRATTGPERFRPILLLHSFRFVGLAFLVPGVVSPDLSAAFAKPAAYGDLIAFLLALAALGALRRKIGPVLLWIFNIWGTADLLFAYYQGVIGPRFDVTTLGAAYFIPTVLVPLLLITHGLAFRMLLTRAPEAGQRPA